MCNHFAAYSTYLGGKQLAMYLGIIYCWGRLFALGNIVCLDALSYINIMDPVIVDYNTCII